MPPALEITTAPEEPPQTLMSMQGEHQYILHFMITSGIGQQFVCIYKIGTVSGGISGVTSDPFFLTSSCHAIGGWLITVSDLGHGLSFRYMALAYLKEFTLSSHTV